MTEEENTKPGIDPENLTEVAPKKESLRVGLWKKKSQKGNVYLGGSMPQYWVNYFKNEEVQSEKDAHGRLVFFPKKEFPNLEQFTISMWKTVSRKGLEYLSGMKGKRFSIFATQQKVNPNSPDYSLCISEKSEYTTIDISSKTGTGVNPLVEQPAPTPDDNDDIPF
jgi:hypothetical protein